jgi:periplasmic protein TonB
MNPELILKADMLDIIFENRNKEYGAYELRKHYTGRLQKSLSLIFILTTFLFGINFWMNHRLQRGHIYSVPTAGDTHLTEVDLRPPVSKPMMVERRRMASTQNTVLQIVKDFAPVHPIPTVDEQELKQIGAVNASGDSSTGVVQAQAAGNEPKNNHPAAAENEKETILRVAEKMPEFPGGMKALQVFLSKNLRMPRDMDPGTSVRVLVQFVVDKEGEVNAIELTQSGGQDFDSEVIRVMKKMPRWTPGMQNGGKVAVYFSLPVVFRAGDENE